MIKHLYIECTHTANSALNTGIQRVVRRIVKQLGAQLQDGTPISLLTIETKNFYALDGLPDLRQKTEMESEASLDGCEVIESKVRLKTKLVQYLRDVRETTLDGIRWSPLRDFLAAPRSQFGFSRIIYMLSLIGVYRAIKLSIENSVERTEVTIAQPVSFSKGDVVLMLDSSLHLPAWAAMKDAQGKGAVFISVVYDLIPVTHPQFCNHALSQAFEGWYEQAKDVVDGYIAISQTVQQSLQDYLAEKGTNIPAERLGYFYLGAEFSEQQENARLELEKTLSKDDSYLIVSTIEPRKNHQYLLEVFSQLWLEGSQVKLHIVGWVGWKVADLIQQVKEHPQFNKKLFLWNDLDDSELVYCYKNSKALVFPSYVEGFGLPIIEAQHYQLPVLASDTPIHREVGGDSVIYFDLADSVDLVTKISDVEQGRLSLNKQAHFELTQFTWQHSANRLVQEIQRINATL